jgi:hypothetical protein
MVLVHAKYMLFHLIFPGFSPIFFVAGQPFFSTIATLMSVAIMQVT